MLMALKADIEWVIASWQPWPREVKLPSLYSNTSNSCLFQG